MALAATLVANAQTEEFLNMPVIPPITELKVTPQTKMLYINGAKRAGYYSCGLFAIYDGDKKAWGFVDTLGNVVIDFKYDRNFVDLETPIFSDGLCVMRGFDGLITVIDTQGNNPIKDSKGRPGTLQPNLQRLSDFVDGVALMRWRHASGDYVTQFLNKQFKGAYTDQKLAFYEYHSSITAHQLLENRRAYYDFDKRLWGFIDESGTIVVPAQYTVVEAFRDGLALVKAKENPDYWGYIDKTGKMAIEPKFSNRPMSFSEGYAVVTKRGNDRLQKCIINKQGEVVAEFYGEISPFHKGLALVWDYKKSFLINTNMEIVKTFENDAIQFEFKNYYSRNHWVGFSDDITVSNGWLIDYKGNRIMEHAYSYGFYDNRCIIKYGNGFACINKKGEIIFIIKEEEF
jgi:hypothetical protein